ncbi:MAG: cell division protein ZapA [Bacteroidetes bacterium]|nr:cell division protein ZapA [Bacteroidota bacterium]
MQQSIPVNIPVGDRAYRVLIAPNDEERLRKMAKAINDQIQDFKIRFAGKDMQDYLAMVLLWHLSESRLGPNGQGEISAVSEELASLGTLIDNLLESSGDSA